MTIGALVDTRIPKLGTPVAEVLARPGVTVVYTSVDAVQAAGLNGRPRLLIRFRLARAARREADRDDLVGVDLGYGEVSIDRVDIEREPHVMRGKVLSQRLADRIAARMPREHLVDRMRRARRRQQVGLPATRDRAERDEERVAVFAEVHGVAC